MRTALSSFFFFFNDTATTEIYTLSLHDALPILCWTNSKEPAATASPFRQALVSVRQPYRCICLPEGRCPAKARVDRKSTRLNSSHGYISYAVFCLKKKKKTND